MRRPARLLTASALFAALALAACVPLPPTAAQPTPESPHALVEEARLSWLSYVGLIESLSNEPEVTAGMFVEVAGSHHAINLASHINMTRADGWAVEGSPVTESFSLLEGQEEIVAHVCTSTAPMRQIQLETGAVAPFADPEIWEEVLVRFERNDQQRLVVSMRSVVLEHERTCP